MATKTNSSKDKDKDKSKDQDKDKGKGKNKEIKEITIKSCDTESCWQDTVSTAALNTAVSIMDNKSEIISNPIWGILKTVMDTQNLAEVRTQINANSQI